MQKDAPFADIPIVLSVQSSVGVRYRTYECVECGSPFLERDNDTFYNVNNPNEPPEVRIGRDGVISTKCGKCAQKYSVTISVSVQPRRDSLPMYMQPQSIFLAVTPYKKLRDTCCYECGKAFFSISDRIQMIVDNVVPTEFHDDTKLGAMEARCKFQHCKQRYYVRV